MSLIIMKTVAKVRQISEIAMLFVSKSLKKATLSFFPYDTIRFFPSENR